MISEQFFLFLFFVFPIKRFFPAAERNRKRRIFGKKLEPLKIILSSLQICKQVDNSKD